MPVLGLMDDSSMHIILKKTFTFMYFGDAYIHIYNLTDLSIYFNNFHLLNLHFRSYGTYTPFYNLKSNSLHTFYKSLTKHIS